MCVEIMHMTAVYLFVSHHTGIVEWVSACSPESDQQVLGQGSQKVTNTL